MGKARVGVRLKEAVGGNKKSINRSQDLDQLTEKYNALQGKQKNLIIALKHHHAAIGNMAKTRLQVADQLAAITKGSELFDCAGQLPSDTMAKSEVCSYASIHHNLASRTKTYADKYGQFIINYAIEWDKVVTGRVSTGLKQAEQLRRDLDHYQKKVEALRTSVNSVMAKGKQVDSKQQEKLKRNEEKLQTAKEEYNKYATSMCILIEEVTERAWKDIHPMMLKIAQFDMTLSGDEAKALAELNQVQEKLKRLAEIHQLKPQNRLKDIETMTPSLLSTRKEEGGLRIEADPNSSGAFGDMSSPMGMAMPPGTVSPQGMGGFPVPVSQSASGVSRDSSVSSFSSAPHTGYGQTTMGTSEMLSIAAAAAPPPSMDEITNATQNSLTISTSPTNQYSLGTPPTHNGYTRSASLPPDYANPPASGGYPRSSSVVSDVSSVASYTSAPVAPAPAAPPPPPPGAMSMYPQVAPAPYSAPVPLPPASYGAPAPMAPPPPAAYGTQPYGMQPYGTQPYGTQPAHPWSGGETAPSNQFGAPSPLANPYGNQ